MAKEFRGKRFSITWLNGRAVGEHARSLINECKKLVREEHNVPLKVKTWRDVPYEKKRKLFNHILVHSITYPNISIISYYIYTFISCLILLFIIFFGVFQSWGSRGRCLATNEWFFKKLSWLPKEKMVKAIWWCNRTNKNKCTTRNNEGWLEWSCWLVD